MKVLQVIPSLSGGGAETLVSELSIALKNRNIKCDILSLYNSSQYSLYKKLKDNGVEVFSLNKSNGFHPAILLSIARFISRNKYDVVHVHIGAIKYVLLASILCKQVRFVATIHSEAKREAGKSLDKFARKFMFKRNLCIPVTISDESERSFEYFYGFPAKMNPNGVSAYNKPLNRRQKENIVFIHPASCQPVKNQALLIDAFNKLKQEFPKAKLIWVGRNNTFAELFASLSRKFGENIEYQGESDNARELMAEADAMCLSSSMEGMPMTVIEAFSVGCIPICTPVGGCKDVVKNGVNGLLSRDLSVEGYYDALKSFCQLSQTEIADMRANAIKSFEAFSIDHCCDRYLEIYAQE